MYNMLVDWVGWVGLGWLGWVGWAGLGWLGWFGWLVNDDKQETMQHWVYLITPRNVDYIELKK